MVAEKAFSNQGSLSDTSGPHSRSRGTHLNTFHEKSRKISNHLEKQRGRKIKVKGDRLDARRDEQRNDVASFSSITESSLKNTGWSLPAPKSMGWQGIKVIQMQALMDVPKIYCFHSILSLLMEEDDCAAHPDCVLTGCPRRRRRRLRVLPKKESI